MLHAFSMLFWETKHHTSFDLFTAEAKIKCILENISGVFVDEIEDAVTAKNLCLCRNPVTTAFEVSPCIKIAGVSDNCN